MAIAINEKWDDWKYILPKDIIQRWSRENGNKDEPTPNYRGSTSIASIAANYGNNGNNGNNGNKAASRRYPGFTSGSPIGYEATHIDSNGGRCTLLILELVNQGVD